MDWGGAVYHPRPPALRSDRIRAKPFDVHNFETPSAADDQPLPPLRASYVPASAEPLADAEVLAVIGFGRDAARATDPRYLHIGLEPVGDSLLEVWRGHGQVRTGDVDGLRWSCDDDYVFFAVEADEARHGGIEAAAEAAYRSIADLIADFRFSDGAHGHILRLWNYMDAINEGEGDDERYRQFCSGRARGITAAARNGYSAATAVGRRDGIRVLQVYGLAARRAGIAVENPRQVSAWTYPRQYGPVAPTFARATRTAADQLLVSGTAAVVGHQTQHVGDTLAQLDETLRNLDSLLQAAGAGDAPQGMSTTLLKVYLRDAGDAEAVSEVLRRRHPELAGQMVLLSDICRDNLRIEIDGIRG
jgi:chorismate lyase/3-hydroxybenzoate synthase